jgi:hypothetical protein
MSVRGEVSWSSIDDGVVVEEVTVQRKLARRSGSELRTS